MSNFVLKLTIVLALTVNSIALLNGVTTQQASKTLKSQINQILNQNSILKSELEKEIQALKSKVESLEVSSQDDKKTIAYLSNQTHQASLLNVENEKRIRALESKVATLESTLLDDKLTITNLTLALADPLRQAEERSMRHDDEIYHLKAYAANNQSLLHLNGVITNISKVVSERLQYLEQQLPTLARKEPSVAFLVFLSDDIHTHHGPVIFDSTKLNIGNAYNTHTGIFMAPETGVYSFAISLAGDDGDVHGYIRQNGQYTGYVFADDIGSTKYQRASLSITLHCNKGDKVWFDCIDNGNRIICGYQNTWFSGHLVHMEQ